MTICSLKKPKRLRGTCLGRRLTARIALLAGSLAAANGTPERHLFKSAHSFELFCLALVRRPPDAFSLRLLGFGLCLHEQGSGDWLLREICQVSRVMGHNLATN